MNQALNTVEAPYIIADVAFQGPGSGITGFAPGLTTGDSAAVFSALASTASGQGDALIAVAAPVIGAATINQGQKNAQTLTMKDFPVNADGVTDDAANILAATTGIGYLIFPAGTYAINSNLTIPASCNIRMEPGAVFNVANGVTLTINGGLTAGQHQIFVLNATAVMKGQGLKNLEVAWFGAKPDGNILGSPYTYTTDNAPAFTAAIKVATAVWNASGAACSIHAPAGAYGFSSGLIIQNAMTIYGDGMWNTILFTSTSLNVPLISATQGAGGDPAMVFGMTLLGNQVGGNTGCFGLSVHLDAFIADRLWINGFYNGVVSYGGDNWFRCVIVEMCGNNGFVVNDGATTISDCVTYQNIWGINIQNGSASDNFATCITNTRSEDDYQGGMIIQSGHDVQVDNYSVCNNSSALYCTVAGIRVDGTSKCIQFNNVKLSNDGAPSQTAPGIWVLGGTDIEFTNCNAKNWLDGMKIDGGSVRVNGGYRGNNFRHGINANSFAGAVLTVTGGECSNNGQNIAGTTVNTGSMTASVNASNQLVVTAVLSGLGPLLQQEVRGVTTALPIGTYITGKISGAYGSTGTFSLSTTPGTVASQTVNSVVCGLTGRLNAVGYQRLIVTGGFVATQGGGGPQTYGVTVACDAATSLARVSESILAFNGSSSSGSVGTNQLASGANSANVTFTGITY